MKLRLILLVLSLLSFLSVSVGGYLYYANLREAAFHEAERQSLNRLVAIKRNLSTFLSENVKPVRVMAGMKEIREALVRPDAASLAQANAMLDYFQRTLGAAVCYLMDRRGDTIASSNRHATDSFVGVNFAFRPYFQQAIAGHPSSYLAIGITSKKRGAYYSQPVYGKQKAPLGVVVIKASIGSIEEELGADRDEIVLVTDPAGIIFISSRKDWLNHTVHQLSSAQAAKIRQSAQFGPGPWPWTGLSFKGPNTAVNAAGVEYMMHRLVLDKFPGWQVINLRSLKAITKTVSDPIIEITGQIILILLLFIGLAVGILYRKASQELIRRREAERALKQAQEELRSYSRDLERQIRKRTREIASIFRYTPAVVYIKDGEGRYTLINPRFEKLFGLSQEEVRGKTDYDIFPKDTADRLKANDSQVLATKVCQQVEEQIPQADGVHTYLSVKFPIYDDSRTISGLCGISMDITEVKKAQDQLRRLSGSIIAGQEKERTAIARELHDELGQMLTALRLDCVWLSERLQEADAQARERTSGMCGLIDKGIKEVREMAVRLRPGVLDRLGLVDALEWYATDFERRTGITCLFGHDGVPAIPDNVATAAYRIAQEALTNVARHAGANLVKVRLQAEDGLLTLTVSDNGRGFDPGKLPEEGLGIAGMKERASLVGGKLELQSRADKGTRVYFKVPVEPASSTASPATGDKIKLNQAS